jgi:addiction module HigA family antidote
VEPEITDDRPFEPDWVLIPGENLQDAMSAKSWSAEQLAEKSLLRLAQIEAVLQGRTYINAEIAIALAHTFNTSKEYWLNLQHNYDKDCARLGKENITRQEHKYNYFVSFAIQHPGNQHSFHSSVFLCNSRLQDAKQIEAAQAEILQQVCTQQQISVDYRGSLEIILLNIQLLNVISQDA